MENIVIRPALPKDGKKICEMLCDIGALHHNGRPDIYRDNLRKYNEEQFADILLDPSAPVIAAVDENDAVVGYAFLQIKEVKDNAALCDRKYIYIDDFCVDESLRGRHIGRTLMTGVYDYARSIGISDIELNVWEFNENAIKFYERCGMTTQRRHMEIKL